MEDVHKILRFLALAEKLKTELRHSWLSSGRRESVAEHSWQMALMALVMHRRLEIPVDLEKTLKMVLVHDLVEAEAGDVPSFEEGERKRLKARREREAIERIRDLLADAAGREIFELWHEHEARTSNEARFVAALDNLEVQIQHNLADLSTWEEIEYDLVYTKMDEPCAHEPFLRAFCAAVKAEAEGKMARGGVDTAAVKARLGQAEDETAAPA